MDTITDIEQQLDEMSDEFSPRPTIPAPVRGSVGETVTVGAFQFSMIHTPSPVLERPEGDNFNEEEWLCDDPTMEPRPPPAESHGRLMDEVRQSVLASPESAQVETVPPTSAAPLTSVAPLTSAAPPTSAATPTSDHHRKGKQVPHCLSTDLVLCCGASAQFPSPAGDTATVAIVIQSCDLDHTHFR